MANPSSSSSDDNNRWGTVFMGPSAARESTIDKVAEAQQRDRWNRRTEAEYMERVRVRATMRVQIMLNDARRDAETIRTTANKYAEKMKAEIDALMAKAEKKQQEAEALMAEATKEREQAQEKGYNQGLENVQHDVEEHTMALDDATSSVLKSIEEQCGNIFAAWRQELTELLCDAVAATSGWVITADRHSILENLLQEAVQELSDRRRISIRVNPQDFDAVNMVIDSAKKRFPELQSWEVRPDDTVDACGLIVESSSGMVDTRQKVRREFVTDILQKLSLPSSKADDDALAAVSHVMQETGMNDLVAAADARIAEEMATQETPEAPQEITPIPETQIQEPAPQEMPLAPEVTQSTAPATSLENSAPETEQFPEIPDVTTPPVENNHES